MSPRGAPSPGTNIATFTWTISNFKEVTNKIESPQFTFPRSKGIQFSLGLHPNTRLPITEPHHHVLIWLNLLKYDLVESSKLGRIQTKALPVCFRVLILKANEVKSKMHESKTTLSLHESPSMNSRCVQVLIQRDILLNPAKALLVNGDLKIYCEVELVDRCTNSTTFHDQKKLDETLRAMEVMLSDAKHSDIVLVAAGKKIAAHKVILAANSPVFAAMFEHNCKETNESKVVIDDCKHEVFQEMLYYIYTSKSPDLIHHAPELLALAEKYQIESLKSRCERFLITKLDIENACDTLQLANLHQAHELEQTTLDYITNRLEQIIQSNGYKELKKNPNTNKIESLAKIVEQVVMKKGSQS